MTEYDHIEVILHDDPAIFEVIFKDNSRAAVDDYVQAIHVFAEQLRAKNALDKPIWMLIDVTQSGLYSLQYSRAKVAELIKQIQDIPKAYFAYLVENHNDRYVIENFSMTSNPRQQDVRMVFSGAERDRAITWLLSNTEM